MRHFPLTHKLKSLVGIQEPTIINNSKGHPVLVILPLHEEIEDGSWPTDRTHELQSLAQNWTQELQQRFNSQSPALERSGEPSNEGEDKVELGMVEVNIAIAGIAIGIATIIQNTTNSGTPTTDLKITIAIFSAALAIFPTYAAIDLLARYEIGSELPPWQRIINFFQKKDGPYWLVGISLFVLLLFSSLLGALLIFVSPTESAIPS